jgi:hypothetical protein
MAFVARSWNYKSGQLCDEQFGFRHRHSRGLQLARLVQMVNRNSDVRHITGAVLVDVAEAFYTGWDKFSFTCQSF